MRKFKVSLGKFIFMLFPRKWQTAIMMAWLRCIVKPLIRLGSELDIFRKSNIYRLLRGPQVVHIECVLNDRWDAEERRIYIVDGSAYEPLYIYRDAEGKQAPYIYLEAEGEQAPYIYTEAEINAVGIDFIIRIPVTIVFDMNELKALVDRYRLPGKVYIIETF